MPSTANCVSFDQLPVELIQKIFHYLHYYEIFQSFANINRRLNDILSNYDQYRLNLQSISLSNFYQTLKFIRPEQIISLTLSNVDDTPGEMDVFLSMFSIKQFHRLECLRLIQPTDSESLNGILQDLSELKYLNSLSIIHCQPSSVNGQTFTYLARFLDESNSLARLNLTGALNALFEFQFHSSIEHFYYNDNVFSTISLSTIAARMKNLKSLHTGITRTIDPTNLPMFTNLRRLNVTIFIQMNNADLRNIFDRTPSLVDLKVVANGKQWFNGHFWEESLPKSLVQFQFNFCTQSIHLDESIILETFQTPFWIQRKRWYVMLDYQMNPTMAHLYSLPYCDRQFYYRPSMDIHRQYRSSGPIGRFYMNNVTKLTFDFSTLVTEANPTLISSHYYPNVSTLILSDNSYLASVQPLFTCLKSIVNLNRVVELKLGHFHYPDLIRLIHSSMPNLRTLWIAETMFAKLEMLNFRHIRSLIICDCLTNVDRLCLMFPQLIKLSIRVSTFERMRRVVELLDKTIRNLTFKHVQPSLENQFIQWLTKHYENHRQFIYTTDAHLSLHVWFTDGSR